MYEIFKFVKQKEGEVEAIKIAAQLKQGQVLPLTEIIALEAANISINYKLAMADSLIYASAKVANAIVWTQDKDFEGLPEVKYYAKK
jgi:predicted nucleic acid-binding protein